MNDLAKLHDDALEFEISILQSAEELGNIRNRMYQKREANELIYILPVLNSIIADADRYKGWILECNKDWKVNISGGGIGWET